MSAQDRFLTYAEVAAELKVDLRTVKRYVQGGKLRVHRLSRKCVRIDREDFQRFLKARRVA